MKKSLSRRDFLALAGKSCLALAGLLGADILLRFISYSAGPERPTEFDLGSADQYPPGSRTVIGQANALLVHTPAGFRAISLTCTHLGCSVKPTSSGFACPCHNSQFDSDGNVVQGPASRPLEVYSVQQTADMKLILKITTGRG